MHKRVHKATQDQTRRHLVIRTVMVIIAVVYISTFLIACASQGDAQQRLTFYDEFDDIRALTTSDAQYTIVTRIALGVKPRDKDLMDEIEVKKRTVEAMVRDYFKEPPPAQVDAEKQKNKMEQELLQLLDPIFQTGRIIKVTLTQIAFIKM